MDAPYHTWSEFARLCKRAPSWQFVAKKIGTNISTIHYWAANNRVPHKAIEKIVSLEQ